MALDVGLTLAILSLVGLVFVSQRAQSSPRVPRTARGGHAVRATVFAPLIDATGLDDLFNRSHAAPVALFLHDPGCPVSGGAYRQMTRVGSEMVLFDVRGAHGLSHRIEMRTGVRHESPQVIVLRQGQAVWSASHGHITAEAVSRALAVITPDRTA